MDLISLGVFCPLRIKTKWAILLCLCVWVCFYILVGSRCPQKYRNIIFMGLRIWLSATRKMIFFFLFLWVFFFKSPNHWPFYSTWLTTMSCLVDKGVCALHECSQMRFYSITKSCFSTKLKMRAVYHVNIIGGIYCLSCKKYCFPLSRILAWV